MIVEIEQSRENESNFRKYLSFEVVKHTTKPRRERLARK